MIEKIMKAVKRNNKRRSVNITVGAVVGFLLSCTSVMGAAVEITEDGAKFTVTEITEITENTFENNTYTNNGEIKPASGTGGIKISGTSTNMELSFVNNGVVDVESYEGMKIDATADITGKITNNGVISSKATEGIKILGKLTADAADVAGIAIENNGAIEAKTLGINMEGKATEVTGNIINKGEIQSESAGIRIWKVTGDVENEGILNSLQSSGIVLYDRGELKGNIKNDGFIGNKRLLTKVKTGISTVGIITGEGRNNGRIISNTTLDSYGIFAPGDITSGITNSGYLDIKSTGALGIGIQVKDLTSGITNNGNIKVEGSTEATGIKIKGTSKLFNDGLINSESAIGVEIETDAVSNGNFNQGVIYGKTNAIKNDGTISLTNYGLLINADKNNINMLSGVTNKGIIFSVGNNPNQYFIEDVNNSGSIIARTVINADLKDDYGPDTKEVSGTKSIKSSELGDKYKNNHNVYIMSGINDTLVVNSTAELGTGSGASASTIINAYGQAMVMNDGTKLTAKNTIFNGGVDGVSATVVLNGNNTLSLTGRGDNNPSIINGKTKIDGNENNFSMDASIQNGDITADGNKNNLSFKNGSIMNGEAAIKGDGNTLEIADSKMNGDIAATGTGNNLSLDESILNGNVAIDGDGNTLNISGENTYINGDMTAVNGKNTLNLDGKSTDGSSLNMFHNVDGFNNMNITGGSVTFFEDSKVTGLDKVTVAEDGTLNLRLEKTPNPSGTGLGEATHALSGNPGLGIEGLDDGGTLRFITNGIGQGVVINDMSIENMHIATNSALDGYKFDEKGNLILAVYGSLEDMKQSGDKTISNLLNENTFDNENFDSIDGIYQGIFNSADNIANLEALKDIMHLDRDSEMYNDSVSREEQLTNLQAYLNEVYTQSPYTLSSELSRKSAGMFRDIVVENMFRPNLNQWMIMGGLTHVDGGTKDTYYGEVYQIDDSSSSTTDVDTKLTGAYALGKYGYSENVTLGVTVGGNRSEAELSRSKVKGNSGYIGAFAENYRGNLTLKAGAGVQYSEYDADRGTIGGYSYSDKYSDMTYDIYLNGRYSNAVGENLFLEPYATLSYTYVDQDGINEGNKALAMKTDSKSFEYTAAKVGVDLKKVIPHETGKSTLSAGLSYTKLLSGADADSLRGNFGGSDFDILVASKNEHSLGLNAKYALELQSGILFDVKGSYSFERDSHNGNTKNRNKGEWIVGAGLGYKF